MEYVKKKYEEDDYDLGTAEKYHIKNFVSKGGYFYFYFIWDSKSKFKRVS
jgi:hypothetical protein